MPNDKDGQDPAGNPDSQPQVPSPMEPTIEQRVMALETKCNARNEQNNSNDLTAAVKKGEAWLIGINAALLIATIVIACIYYGQLNQMRIATEATKKSVDL